MSSWYFTLAILHPGDGDSRYYSDSETDTASTYYDDEDADSTEATSCTTLASYDDITEATLYDELDTKPKPTTSTGGRKRTKSLGAKSTAAASTSNKKPVKARAPVKRVANRKKVTKAAAAKESETPTTKQPKAAKPATKQETAKKPATRSRTRAKNPKNPRVRLTRKTVILKKTPGSVSVNLSAAEVKSVTASSESKPVLPRKSSSDGKIKPAVAAVAAPDKDTYTSTPTTP